MLPLTREGNASGCVDGTDPPPPSPHYHSPHRPPAPAGRARGRGMPPGVWTGCGGGASWRRGGHRCRGKRPRHQGAVTARVTAREGGERVTARGDERRDISDTTEGKAFIANICLTIPMVVASCCSLRYLRGRLCRLSWRLRGVTWRLREVTRMLRGVTWRLREVTWRLR